MPTLKQVRKSEVSLDCDPAAAPASSAASAAKRGRDIPTLERGPAAAAAASSKQEEMPTPERLRKSSWVPTRPDADDEHDSDGNGDSDGNDEYKDDSSPSSSSSSSSGDDYSESSADHCDDEDEDEDEEVRGEKGVANDASKCPLHERKPAAVTTTGSAMRRGGKSEMIDVIDLCGSSDDDPAAVEPSNHRKKSIITGKMKDDGGNVIVKDESNNNAAPRSNETNDIEIGKRGNGKKRSGAGDGKRKDNSRNAKEDNSGNAKDVDEEVAKSKTKNGVNFGKGKLGNKNKKTGDVVVRGKSTRGNKGQCDDEDEKYDGDDVTANDTELVGTHRVITLRTARDSIRLVAAFVRGLEDGGADPSFARDFFAPLWSRLEEQGDDGRRDRSRRRRKGGGRDSCRWRRIESIMAYSPPPSPSRAVYSGEALVAGRDYHPSEESVALCVLEDISTLEEVSGQYAIHVHRFATMMPILDRAVTDDVDFGEARRRIIAHDKKKSVDTDDKNRNVVAVSNRPTLRAPVVTYEDSVKSNLSGQCHLFILEASY